MAAESSDVFHSGFVALVGRPNVGKSTLLNACLGHRVAITSPVAQTTRKRLRAVITTNSSQWIRPVCTSPRMLWAKSSIERRWVSLPMWMWLPYSLMLQNRWVREMSGWPHIWLLHLRLSC